MFVGKFKQSLKGAKFLSTCTLCSHHGENHLIYVCCIWFNQGRGLNVHQNRKTKQTEQTRQLSTLFRPSTLILLCI